MKKTFATNGEFKLMTLPYADTALQPVISAETLGFHHGKHLQAYVTNLNAAIAGTDWQQMALEDIVVKAEGGMFNNAGQLLNHNMYFGQFRAPQENNRPTGTLLAAIEAQWGKFEDFQKEFEQKGASLFGSGWVWLSADAEGRLQITQNANADNPLCHGLTPLLTFDVWEHAYYLDYQNRRAAYLSALWPLIDWQVVAERM